MSGFDEIESFGKAWRGTSNFKVKDNGDFVFAAEVIYESISRGREVQSCTVQIFRNGASDGNIEIYPKGKLQPDSHHLGFVVKYQKYTFSPKDKALLLAGSSPKMGGAYSATLLPNGKVPSFID